MKRTEKREHQYECEVCGEYFNRDELAHQTGYFICFDCEAVHIELETTDHKAEQNFRSQCGGPHYVGGVR